MKTLQRIVSIVLAVAGATLLAAGAVLLWAESNVFDTEQVVERADEALSSEPVQALLIDRTVDRVMQYVGNEALRSQVTTIVTDAVESEQIQALVNTGVRQAHVVLVTGDGEEIPLRLTALAERVREAIIAEVPELEPQLPPGDEVLDFDFVERADLPEVWRVVDRFRDSAPMVVGLGAVLVGLALVIGPARWLRLVVAGVTFAAFGALNLIGLNAATSEAQDRITDPLALAAADELLSTFFSSLETQSILMLVAGLLAALGGVAVRLMRPEYSRHRDDGLWR